METILSETGLGSDLTSAFERPEYGQQNSAEDRIAMLSGTGKVGGCVVWCVDVHVFSDGQFWGTQNG